MEPRDRHSRSGVGPPCHDGGGARP